MNESKIYLSLDIVNLGHSAFKLKTFLKTYVLNAVFKKIFDQKS